MRAPKGPIYRCERISVHNETYIERGNGLIVSGDLSYLDDLNFLREVPATGEIEKMQKIMTKQTRRKLHVW